MEEEKINNIARKMGATLMDAGIRMIQSVYKNFVPEKTGFYTIEQAFTDVGISIQFSQLDEYYYTTTWDQWELIKDTTLTEKLIYYADKFDCDNFAHLFSSLASLLFNLNTAGVAFGEVFDAKTGKSIGRHYFIMIVDSEGKLYCYEPMNDNWVLVEKGKPIVLAHGWEYRLFSVRFG